MIKLIYCIIRKPGMSEREFFHYWEKIHAPIGARIPHVRRFVQSHSLNIAGDTYRPAYDGVTELWFDNVEDLLAARRSPEWKAATDDEPNFIDHKKVAYLVSEEHVILDRMEPGSAIAESGHRQGRKPAQ